MSISTFHETFICRLIARILIVTLSSYGIPASAAIPIADAGGDRVLEKSIPLGKGVTLRGDNSIDIDGDVLKYQWSGPFGFIEAINPTVELQEGRNSITLIVNDGTENSEPDNALIDIVPCFLLNQTRAKRGKVQVTWNNVADAVKYNIFRATETSPSQFVKIGETESSNLIYIDSSVVNETSYLYLVGATSQNSTCYSNVLSTHPTRRRGTKNYAPLIYSTAVVNARVGLFYNYDVNAIDPNNDTLNYQLLNGPAAMQIDSQTGLIEWIPDQVGNEDVTIQVDDGKGAIEQQSFSIQVDSTVVPNRAPIANAGTDQTLFTNDTAQLDGSGSNDPDGDSLTFKWTITSKPSGSNAILSAQNTLNPYFVLDVPGTYVLQLIVNDGFIESSADSVSITTENSAPVADAGSDQTIKVNEVVHLEGDGSHDVDGDTLSYQWTIVQAPIDSQSTLSDPSSVMPEFIADKPGDYQIQLIVNDGQSNSAPDFIILTTSNSSPIANAGADTSVFVTDIIQLDGSASTDVDGDNITYSWAVLNKPNGSIAELSDASIVNPTLIADLSGTYVVQLIANDGQQNSSADTVTFITDNTLPIANAGSDQTVTLNQTVNLDGSGSSDIDADGLNYLWSLISKPNDSNAALSDILTDSPTFIADKSGIYIAQLIVNDGASDSNPDTVTIATENSKPVADAGTIQNIQENETVHLVGSASTDADNEALAYTWSILSKPVTSQTSLTNSNTVNPSFVADEPGTYVVQLIVNDGVFDSDPATVMVEVSNVNEAPAITSSPVNSATQDQLYNYDVLAEDPDQGDSLSYTLVNAPSGMVINAGTGNIQWTPDHNQPGVNNVTVKVEDQGRLSDSQVFTITVADVNDAPEITSAAVVTGTQGQVYNYDVEATDKDNTDTLTYSLDTAPAGMTINATSGLIQWTPANNQSGVNNVVVRVTDNGGLFATQSFSVNVATINQAPSIISSAPANVTENQLYSYDVNATDPDTGDTLTYSLDIAPAGVTIDASSGLIQWTPNSTQIGANIVTVRVQDVGGLSDTQSFSVTVSATPVLGDFIRPSVTISANPATANVNDPVTITINASDDVGVTATELRINDTVIPLDSNGTAQFTSATADVFSATATAVDANGNTGLSSTEFRLVSANDGVLPEASISTPINEAKLKLPTDIVGTASDTNLVKYRLEYSEKDKNQYIQFATGSTSVTNGILGKIDPTKLRNGLYDIRLTVEDTGGNSVSVKRVYEMDGEAKVGNFSIGFNDLTIPVTGLPITITRTYDSRNKSKGDFGVGWTLNIKDIEITENDILGKGWEQTKSGGFFPTFFLKSTRAHTVTVNYPDGQADRFDMEISPTSSQITPFTQTTTVSSSFKAQSDTHSKLDSLNDNILNLSSGGVGPFTFLDDIIGSPYDPNRYRLTTREGTIYVINQTSGVENITEPNGNTITFGSNGIIHSAGKSVLFERDSEDRIVKITDPKGNTILFEYDFYGDLVAVTDQEGNTSRYTYNFSHGLVEIIDPTGNVPARNEYDADGNLISTTDADGNRIEFTHDVDNRREVIRDRLGNVTVHEYDEEGNVTKTTDALGNTTSFSYDANGNTLTETDPLGHVTTFTYDANDNPLTETDALGNTTTTTYNAKNEIQTITDPLGRLVSSGYDTKGNLTSITDPLGNITTLTYDAKGNISATTDALGQAIRYQYDDSGNTTQETDVLGNITTYIYDANGNRLTETKSRTLADGSTKTLITQTTYDKLNREIKTTFPDGSITETRYNVFGKWSETIDQLGRITRYEYDAIRRLVKTIYPDGSADLVSYDSENNKLSDTDREGQTTHYVYDKVYRLVETILPDGTPNDLSNNPSNRTVYDAAGQVITEIDTRGNQTHYEYDVDGHRTKITDPLGNISTYSFDVAGNQTGFTDANGNTIVYTYDAADRRVQTTFADSSSNSIGYDALGLKISETDQAGKITQFAYDSLGRLVNVIDAEGQITIYGYDEQGNKISQTDAEGRDTLWSYDAQGRILTRALPMGQVQSSSYDAKGNLKSTVDFNGQTTTYTYDSNDRQTKTVYADGQIDEQSYDAVGNRIQSTITLGSEIRTVQYSYDNRDRLVQEQQANGSTLNYQYDSEGNRTELEVINGADISATSYTFDILNRLETVTSAENNVTQYDYDAVGNRSSITHSNGNKAIYSYDALNRLTSLTHQDVSSSVIASFAYTLNASGKRTKIVELSGRTTDYSYDSVYRLLTESISDASNGAYNVSYTYDTVGNRIQSVVDGVTTAYSYDDNDRLQQQGGTIYIYDNNGNTLTKTLGGNSKNFSYNAKNQLSEVKNTGVTTNYQYNLDGVRTGQTSGADTTLYVVDSNLNYAQVIQEQINGTKTVSYTYGDDLISQTRNNTTHDYHYDGLGSTRYLSDGTGALTDSYHYEAFGQLLNETGATENSYRFAGEQLDQNLDQYYLRARYYDQNTGRFTQMDTWMGSNADPVTLHKYLYANADPANTIDPSGQFGIASVGISINISISLVTAFHTGFTIGEFATGQREFSPKEVGIAFLWAYAGSKASILTRPFQTFLKKSGCLSNSFASDTLVDTENGLKRIDTINIGELVLSFNELTGENEYQPVTAIMKSTKETELIVIGLKEGSKVEATPEHLFYTDGKWIQAQEITDSMFLHNSDGIKVKVDNIKRVVRTETVYDLTIKKNHNFYVTKNKVLVHNISPCEKAAQALIKFVPKTCIGNFRCKQFAVSFERLLLDKKVKGKRLCLKSKAGILSGSKGLISEDGIHLAIQIGELVFDNNNTNGVPYSEWLNDLGGEGYIQPQGRGAEIDIHTEELGSKSKCL